MFSKITSDSIMNRRLRFQKVGFDSHLKNFPVTQFSLTFCLTFVYFNFLISFVTV